MATILPNLQQQLELANAALAAANAKLATLEARGTGRITPKVSKKGAVSVYGLGRFPVTLYAGQMERLAEAMPSIMAWIKTNPTTTHDDVGVVSLVRKS